jgi:hypothetical protein
MGGCGMPPNGGNSLTGIIPSATDEVLKLRKEVQFHPINLNTDTIERSRLYQRKSYSLLESGIVRVVVERRQGQGREPKTYA